MQRSGGLEVTSDDLFDDGDGEADGDADDEPIDFRALDPDAWYPGIPWRPPLALVGWIVAIPGLSYLLRGFVLERAAREDPGQLGLLDLWGSLILGAVLGGIALAAIVPIATRIAYGRDRLILALLEKGFRVGVLLVVAIIAVQTVLAAGMLIGLEYVVLGNAFPGSAGIVLLAGLVSATSFAAPALGSLRTGTGWVPAIALDAESAPGLIERVGSLALDVGVDPPSAILVGPAMDWWTANATVKTLEGDVSGGLLHVSLPQLALLSEPEVDAILAHELAHRRPGKMEVGDRIARSFQRVGAAIEALKSESRGIGSITAAPGIAWIGFASDAISVAASERYRLAEAAADAVAAELVGPDPVATSLMALEASLAVEDDWDAALTRAVKGGRRDPVRTFAVGARRRLRAATAHDVIVESLDTMGPTHPPLLSRLRTLGQEDVEFALTRSPACQTLLADPASTTRRLVDLLRGLDSQPDDVELNAPRVTAGAIGWLITGLVFAFLLTRSWVSSGPVGDLPIITALVTCLWLLFPVVYPWLQREAVVDQHGIRVRPWWWRWLDPGGERLGWSRVRWTADLNIKVGFDTIVTITDGKSRLWFWADIWRRSDRDRLYDAVRERGARIEFQFLAGDRDQSRRAVIYYVGGALLVPTLKRMPSGEIAEVQPVKKAKVGGLGLSFALIDRLDSPVGEARAKNAVIGVDDLAALVDLTASAFQETVRRVVIEGGNEEWTIRVDGTDDSWVARRAAVGNADLDEAVYAILDIDPTNGDLHATDAEGEPLKTTTEDTSGSQPTPDT